MSLWFLVQVLPPEFLEPLQEISTGEYSLVELGVVQFAFVFASSSILSTPHDALSATTVIFLSD